MKLHRTTIYILSFFIGIAAISYSQTRTLDSLKLLLKKDKEDTNKVIHLNAMGLELIYLDPDTCIRIGEHSFQLAKKLKWDIGIAMSQYIIAAGYMENNEYELALREFDKLEQLWENAEKNTTAEGRKDALGYKAAALGRVAMIYNEKRDFLKTIKFYKEALKIATQIKDVKMTAILIAGIGSAYADEGSYASALQYIDQALSLNKSIKNEIGVSDNFVRIGIVYIELGEYHKALNNYLKALKINETLGRKSEISIDLGNIGNVYFRQGNTKKALECYLKSLKISENMKDKFGMATQLGNIGVMYDEMKDPDQALNYLWMAKKLDEENGNKEGLATDLNNIGNVYLDKLENETALDNYLQALKIDEETGNTIAVARDRCNIGDAYLQMMLKSHNKKPLMDKAENNLLKALYSAQKFGSVEIERQVELTLKDLYTATGEHKKALEHFKTFRNISDSMFSAEKNKEFTRHEMNYEFDKKEAAIKAEQDKKNAVGLAERKKQKLVLILVCCVLLLVFIFAIFISRSLRITKKQTLLIAIKNRETEEQKNIIEEKNKDIMDSIRYAKRIQTALLPTEKYIERNIKKLKAEG